MAERKRLIITAIALGLVSILTGRFLNGDLLPSQGAEQFDESTMTSEKALIVVHGHDNIVQHDHIVKTVITTTETTPHAWFHNFGETLTGGFQQAQTVTEKQESNEIWVWGREFTPNTLTVPVGTKITWVNKSVEIHTVTGDFFDSQLYLMGSIADTFSYTFNEPGTYDFRCRPHAAMTGKIIVTASTNGT